MLRTFPRGWPGVGLLLLRVVVGGTVLAQGLHPVRGEASSRVVWIVGGLAVCGGVALLMGRYTSIAALIVSIGTIGVAIGWIPWSDTVPLDSGVSAIFVVSMCLAIALLGPGALSIDARLRRRREIVITSRD